MANYVTQEQFEGSIASLRQDFRDMLGELRQRFHQVDVRLNTLESKSDAIIELLVTRRELRNLTRELRNQGIPIADHKVFE